MKHFQSPLMFPIRCMFVMLLFVTIVLPSAAKELDYPARNLIEKGKYDKALEQLYKIRVKNSRDYTMAFAYYKLWSAPANPDRNLKRAYQWLYASQDSLAVYPSKDIVKAEKIGYTEALYTQELTNVGNMAIDEVEKTNTVEAWNEWLDTYTRVPETLRSYVTAKRDALAFKNAKAINEPWAYQGFLDTYKDADPKLIREATELLEEVVYQAAVKARDAQELYTFIITYPDAKQVQQAWKDIDRLAAAKAAQAGSAWQDSIRRTMHMVRAHHSIEDAKWGLIYLPQPYRDTCWLVLREVCMQYIEIKEFESFNKTYRFRGIDSLQTQDVRRIKAYHDYIDDKISQSKFITDMAPAYPAYLEMRSTVSNDIKSLRWDKALAKVIKYKDVFGDDYRYNNLMRVLTEKDTTGIHAEPVKGGVNADDRDEYVPVITADGKHLYFCASIGTKDKVNEDIFVSELVDGVWSPAQSVKDLNTSTDNESATSLSADGTSMILFLSGKLCLTHLTKDGWSKPESLPDRINYSKWQSDAMITSDGQAMLFSSKRKIPQETEQSESINIFVSLLQENGEWGEPIDLGPNVNTLLDDRSPFLHPDMKTLYFSSRGHGSIGNLDVFKTTRLRDDSWTEWSKPVNMGRLVNSVRNDWGYIISTDGNLAYFAKYVDDKEDIYQLALPKHLRPDPVATIAGTIRDNDSLPVSTSIRWEDLETHTVIGQSKSNPVDGSFFIVLPEGKNYGYFIEDSVYFPVSDNIDLREVNEPVRIEKDICVTAIALMIEQEVPVPMNNLFFDSGEFALLPTSITELDRVAKILIERQLKVEIGGHTDNVGSDKSNITLSRNRADAVRDYLISAGVDPSLLVTHGYGRTQPVDTNDTEEGRQNNRRVELKFVK